MAEAENQGMLVDRKRLKGSDTMLEGFARKALVGWKDQGDRGSDMKR